MTVVEGTHRSGDGERVVAYRVEYDVVGNVVHYTATFEGASGPSSHEGQFDFDPSKVDAATAVDAFMRNHIGKADFDVAP